MNQGTLPITATYAPLPCAAAKLIPPLGNSPTLEVALRGRAGLRGNSCFCVRRLHVCKSSLLDEMDDIMMIHVVASTSPSLDHALVFEGHMGLTVHASLA